MSENKECLFYIDHNPPEYSGTWGGAIHKGACKINSTDCKDTDGCFIKNLYSKLQAKEQSEERLVKQIQTICDFINNRQEILKGIYGDVDKIITKYAKNKEQECEELKEELKINQKFVHDGSIKSTALCKTLEKYKRALDKIEEILDNGTADTQTNNAKWVHEYYLARYCEIREIINKAKEK